MDINKQKKVEHTVIHMYKLPVMPDMHELWTKYS